MRSVSLYEDMVMEMVFDLPITVLISCIEDEVGDD